MKRLAVLLTILFSCTVLSAQNRMSSAELSYLYDTNHEFLVDYRLAQRGDQIKVFIKFTLNSGFVKIGDFNLRYDLRDNYISEKKNGAGTRLDSSHVIGNGFREFFYAFEFEKKSDENLIVLEIQNVVKRESNYLDIPISTNPKLQNQSFLVFNAKGDLPLFTKHINVGTEVRFKNVFINEGSFSINGEINNKPVAMPPFDETQLTASAPVALDTVYGARHDEPFVFNNEGFYVIKDSNAPDSSIGILVTDEFYPHYSEYKKMTQPLIYITTSTEYNNFRESDDTRKEFEDFVMNTINNNPNIAADFVKYYFRRVKDSGFYFTQTQEGWKTDKGMLYQVFGRPRQVFRNESSELWVYGFENGGRVRLVFDINSGKGHVREYNLIRGKKYREIWMSAVSRWRNGEVID